MIIKAFRSCRAVSSRGDALAILIFMAQLPQLTGVGWETYAMVAGGLSGVAALDKIVARLRGKGRKVEVLGYNEASADIVDRFALYDKTGFELGAVPH